MFSPQAMPFPLRSVKGAVDKTRGGDSRFFSAAGFDQAAFSSYVTEPGRATGQIHEVNSANSVWNQQWDLRTPQELPGIPGVERWFGDNNFSLVPDIINFPNMVNSDCVYRFNSFNVTNVATASNFNSVQQVRVGLRCQFQGLATA